MKNLKHTMAAALAIGILAMPSLHAEQPNLLSNGDFKKGMEGWMAKVRNTAEGSVEISDEGPISGDPALKITVTAAGKQWWDVFVELTGVPLQEGKTYRFLFMARFEPKASVLLQIQNNDGTDKRVLAPKKTIGINDEWNEYEYVFVAEGSTSNAVIHFGNMNRSESTYWLANASLEMED